MKWNKMRNLKRGKRFQLPLPFEFLLQQIVNLPQSLWYIWSNELMSIFDTVSDHFALVKMGALMQLNQMCHDWPNIFLTIFTLVSCQFALAKICRNTQLKYHLFKSYIIIFILFLLYSVWFPLQSSRWCEIHLRQNELTSKKCFTSELILPRRDPSPPNKMTPKCLARWKSSGLLV